MTLTIPSRRNFSQQFVWPLFAVLVGSLILTGCSRQLMPTPSIYAGTEENPFTIVPKPFQGDVVDVLYVTDRVPTKGNQYYGADRSQSQAFGSCKVQIGDGLTWEELVQQSRKKNRTKNCTLSISEVTEQKRFPETPQPLPDDITDRSTPTPTKNNAAEALKKEVRRRLAGTPNKEVYIFIHGFNNTFSDAVFGIAELWHFLGRKGVPIAYTWPAGKSYAYDRESSEFTIYHLKQLLQTLAEIDELENINIIAHSRGTDVAVTAMRELLMKSDGAGQNPRKRWKIGHVILAAPDLDVGVVGQRVSGEWFWRIVDGLTLYVNESDKAIGAAEFLFKGKTRIGQLKAKELTVAQQKMLRQTDRTDIVNCQVPTSFIGHSYYHNSPYVSSDLIRRLQGWAPGSSKRPLEKVYEHYWLLRPDR